MNDEGFKQNVHVRKYRQNQYERHVEVNFEEVR
jgi:hypothetical protein